MLNPEDRNAIEGLFQRLKDVERKADSRDPEAEALIRDEIARQPGAPYYLAQTVLVQEHALSVAQQRIAALEAEAERGRRSDPFGGLFGGGRNNDRRPQRYEPAERGGPWDRQDRNADQRGGGGFLAGAAQTALGVTGGVLLGSAIAGMLGAGAATAAEPSQDAAPDQNAGDNGADTDAGSDNDFGDFGGGDGGGFDFGGDF
jgi:hypothetical protein